MARRRTRASQRPRKAKPEDRGSYFDLGPDAQARADRKLAAAFGVDRSADGIYHSPHGRKACLWKDFDYNSAGRIRIWYKSWKDQPPAGDVMVVVDGQGEIVGGVMTETFRRISKKQSDGSFMFDMCMNAHPILFDFRYCKICGEPEAPFGGPENRRCQAHKAAA